MKGTCRKRDCGAPLYAKGLCSGHYHAARRLALGHKPRGEPMDGKLEAKAPPSLLERLATLVPSGEQGAFIRKAVERALRARERALARAASTCAPSPASHQQQRQLR